MLPSSDWSALLEPFRDQFTQPGYRYFCAFVMVLAQLDRASFSHARLLIRIGRSLFHLFLPVLARRRLVRRESQSVPMEVVPISVS